MNAVEIREAFWTYSGAGAWYVTFSPCVTPTPFTFSMRPNTRRGVLAQLSSKANM